MTWNDKLRKVKPNIMTLKIQKDVDKYKVFLIEFLSIKVYSDIDPKLNYFKI